MVDFTGVAHCLIPLSNEILVDILSPFIPNIWQVGQQTGVACAIQFFIRNFFPIFSRKGLSKNIPTVFLWI